MFCILWRGDKNPKKTNRKCYQKLESSDFFSQFLDYLYNIHPLFDQISSLSDFGERELFDDAIRPNGAWTQNFKLKIPVLLIIEYYE